MFCMHIQKFFVQLLGCISTEGLSSRPTVASVVTKNAQVTADSDMIGVVPVRTRPISTHAGF